MCDDDKVGGLQVYMLYVMMIGLEVYMFTSLHDVCDDDKFGSLQVWKLTDLHIVCDDDMFGSLSVYILCVTMISFEV